MQSAPIEDANWPAAHATHDVRPPPGYLPLVLVLVKVGEGDIEDAALEGVGRRLEAGGAVDDRLADVADRKAPGGLDVVALCTYITISVRLVADRADIFESFYFRADRSCSAL